MAVNKVIYGSEVLIDLTDDTVNASSLKQGYTAHDCHGNLITGTHVESGGSSGAGLPDTIEAGDTPIWICYPNHETSSSSSSKYSIGYDFHFVVPKNGTYRFTFVGWSTGTSGTKAGVTLSTTSNKVGTTGLTGTNSTGSTGVLLPYSNADNFATSVDVTVTDKKNVWFFANSGSGQYGSIANRGKIYAVVVSIAWDNGTN